MKKIKISWSLLGLLILIILISATVYVTIVVPWIRYGNLEKTNGDSERERNCLIISTKLWLWEDFGIDPGGYPGFHFTDIKGNTNALELRMKNGSKVNFYDWGEVVNGKIKEMFEGGLSFRNIGNKDLLITCEQIPNLQGSI